jgi:hypothetical protein
VLLTDSATDERNGELCPGSDHSPGDPECQYEEAASNRTSSNRRWDIMPEVVPSTIRFKFGHIEKAASRIMNGTTVGTMIDC